MGVAPWTAIAAPTGWACTWLEFKKDVRTWGGHKSHFLVSRFEAFFLGGFYGPPTFIMWSVSDVFWRWLLCPPQVHAWNAFFKLPKLKNYFRTLIIAEMRNNRWCEN